VVGESASRSDVIVVPGNGSVWLVARQLEDVPPGDACASDEGRASLLSSATRKCMRQAADERAPATRACGLRDAARTCVVSCEWIEKETRSMRFARHLLRASVLVAASFGIGCGRCAKQPPAVLIELWICFADEKQGSMGRAADKSTAIDFEAFLAARLEIVPDSLGGIELEALIAQHHEEVFALTRADATLESRADTLLQEWSFPVRLLVDGFGLEANVTPAMATATDEYFLRLEALASPPLIAAIQQQRAVHPPMQSAVGLNLNQFRELMLPSLGIHEDGFE
jgi:hypothetical protein